MAEEIQPTGEPPAQPVQSTDASVTPPPTTPPASSAEPPIEKWDPERAKATILAQREKEKEYKAQLKELDRLKAEEQKRLDAQLTETERLKKQADELTASNTKLQADILRRDVIAETGLPAVFADRLKGTTKEEMLADAKELLKVLPAEKPKAPHLNNTNPNNANTVETDAQKRERIFGSRGKVFDLTSIQAQGGGVIFPTKPE